MSVTQTGKSKFIEGITPVGTVVWSQIAAPSTKYKSQGEYAIRLRVQTSAETEKIISDMKNLIDDRAEEVRILKRLQDTKTLEINECWEYELGETGEETGYVLFTFKSLASGVNKDGATWTRPIPVFKPDAQPVDSPCHIYPRSEVKISYLLYSYSTSFGIGCTCKLLAVQLFFAAPPMGRKTAKDFGFGKENVDLNSYFYEMIPPIDTHGKKEDIRSNEDEDFMSFDDDGIQENNMNVPF